MSWNNYDDDDEYDDEYDINEEYMKNIQQFLTLNESNLNTAIRTIGQLQQGRSLYRSARNWHRRRTTWRVAIDTESNLYNAVAEWVYRQVAAQKNPDNERVMRAATGRGSRPEVRLFYADTATHRFNLDNKHVVEFKVGSLDDETDVGSALNPVGQAIAAMSPVKRHDCVFTVRSLEARDALIDKIEQVYASYLRNDSRLRHVMSLGGSWSGWEEGKELVRRAPESLSLTEGQFERILDDVQKFQSGADHYAKLGIPYHRGYLFHGPPGTGKTSLAHVLAAALNVDLYVLNLGNLDKDSKLSGAIKNVREGNILLLEDVDVFTASGTRSAEAGTGLSLAALLNALDGVETPHGLITIMTTNYKDRLDPALIRAGRVDVMEELGLPDYEQIARLYKLIYGVSMGRKLPAGKWSPSQVTSTYVEAFKRHLNDPDAAIAELIAIEEISNIPTEEETHA